MELSKNEIVKARRLTEGTGQYFYGYYDLPAWSPDGRLHLCNRVEFMDRMQEKDDVARLGAIEMESGRFVELAETTAWNFQQGAMLQWLPGAAGCEIIYNARDGENYRGVIQNIHTGERRLLDGPIANVDPAGRWALGINFNRLFDYRPGYGYAGVEDPWKSVGHPDDDGIFRIELATGRSRLIVSLQQIWEATRDLLPSPDRKLLVNHINFNTDGGRFVFLARCFRVPGEKGPWVTCVMTANADGSGLYALTGYTYASHYHWRDPAHLLIHCHGDQGDQLYLLTDRSREAAAVDLAFFLRDGHCSYSPDRRWILYDSYPDKDRYRHLYLYSPAMKRGITLGSYYHIGVKHEDMRCDLHPRWNAGGTAISFDSYHEGPHRHVYAMDLRQALADFEAGMI